MTYAEASSIRQVINAFFATGVVDEVVVVNNNAEPGTAEQVALTAARQVYEPRQGYGYASRRGLVEAGGDLIVLAEPDGTFLASDITKLLAYSDNCDAVFGTRTNRELVWSGANMGWLLRWGNWAVAKLVRVLFNASRISDVGCTYRLLSKNLVDEISPSLTIGGSQLGPELILRTVLSGARHVEVPVNYLPRVGTSSVTGKLWRAACLGLQMVLLILLVRLRTLRLPRRSNTLRLTDLTPVQRGAVEATTFPDQRSQDKPDTVIELSPAMGSFDLDELAESRIQHRQAPVHVVDAELSA